MSTVVESGPLMLAVAVSALAGLVSFASPCILPLVPGYVSYVTGLAGADLRESRRGRVLLGCALFVAGFTGVFVLVSAAFGGLGRALLTHQRAIEISAGLLIIGLGIVYLGWVPAALNTKRWQQLPSAGVAAAPVLGAVFALSWTPCLSPTLAAVLGLAAVQQSAGRGALLATAYGLGLGIPFIALGLGFRWTLGLASAIRRHARWVTVIGGVLLIAVGVALVTGAWTEMTNWLRATVGPGEVGI